MEILGGPQITCLKLSVETTTFKTWFTILVVLTLLLVHTHYSVWRYSTQEEGGWQFERTLVGPNGGHCGLGYKRIQSSQIWNNCNHVIKTCLVTKLPIILLQDLFVTGYFLGSNYYNQALTRTGFRKYIQKWICTPLQNYQMDEFHSIVGFSLKFE